jgi:hypothetical protein
VLTGEAELAPVFALDAAPAALRGVVTAALGAGGLWQQMGWTGVVTMPSAVSAVSEPGFWDWMAGAIRHHGANGTVALAVEASLFARDPARGAFAVARAMMDGYFLTVRVNAPEELDALASAAACNVLCCPAAWLDADRRSMDRVYEFASRMSAEIGVHGVHDASVLGRLARQSVRRAQGPAVGRPASAAETYDTHLAKH